MKTGKGTKIYPLANVYGDNTEIGKDCMIANFVEIQDNVKIGNNVRISSHSFICSLTTIEDDVFIGHGVLTINDINPPSKKRTGKEEWKPILIKKGAVIGSGAIIFPVVIGKNAKVSAGAVVTKDVKEKELVMGVPARPIQKIKIIDVKKLYEERR